MHFYEFTEIFRTGVSNNFLWTGVSTKLVVNKRYYTFYSPLLFRTAGSDVVLRVQRDFWKFWAHTHLWARSDFSWSPSSPDLYIRFVGSLVCNSGDCCRQEIWGRWTSGKIRPSTRDRCRQEIQRILYMYIHIYTYDIHTHTHIWLYVCVRVCIYIYIYKRIYVYNISLSPGNHTCHRIHPDHKRFQYWPSFLRKSQTQRCPQTQRSPQTQSGPSTWSCHNTFNR